MLRHSFVILAIVLVSSWVMSACPEKQEKKPPIQTQAPSEETKVTNQINKTLIRALVAEPHNLNPVLSFDVYSGDVQRLIFNPLLSIDSSPNSILVGRLAERWEISADKKTITFFLRPGITWHDGEPFSAEDVKFTFDAPLREDIPSPSIKSLFDILSHVEVMDEHTIAFHFKYAFSPGISKFIGVQIIPKHCLDEQALARETKRRGLEKPVTFMTSSFNRHPIGTGPYIFQEWETAQHIKLKHNQNYWDKKHVPHIEHIMLKIIPKPTVAFNIMQKGELHVLRVLPEQYMQFKRLHHLHQDYVALRFYRPVYYFIAWNQRPEKKFFTERRIRQAMTHALDRKAFIEKVNYGMGKILSGPFYFQSWAYNPHIQAIPFDLEKAAELIQAAGWKDHDNNGIIDKNGVQFEFELLIPSGRQIYAQLAQLIQASLKDMNINVLIRVYEWSVFLEKTRQREFDAYIAGISLDVDPDPYELFHSSQINEGMNDFGYANKKVDKLIAAGRQEFDQTKRQKIYWEIHKIINEDQPCTFIYTPMDIYILSKKIENVQVSPFGLFRFFPGQLSWSFTENQGR
ncbi:peptide-binding protein [candidate division CSSED10-310 bacterium]|uniref:Peptide-binding protein n=1 Tax=candidate division CSSED10-310 bacterium TaxID=2855610 RepID=A0ABV6YRL3_UNCC1